MNSSRVAILEKFLELGRSRDMTALELLVTEDIRINEAQSLPFGGEYVGWAGISRRHRKILWQNALCASRAHRHLGRTAMLFGGSLCATCRQQKDPTKDHDAIA